MRRRAHGAAPGGPSGAAHAHTSDYITWLHALKAKRGRKTLVFCSLVTASALTILMISNLLLQGTLHFLSGLPFLVLLLATQLAFPILRLQRIKVTYESEHLLGALVSTLLRPSSLVYHGLNTVAGTLLAWSLSRLLFPHVAFWSPIRLAGEVGEHTILRAPTLFVLVAVMCFSFFCSVVHTATGCSVIVFPSLQLKPWPRFQARIPTIILTAFFASAVFAGLVYAAFSFAFADLPTFAALLSGDNFVFDYVDPLSWVTAGRLFLLCFIISFCFELSYHVVQVVTTQHVEVPHKLLTFALRDKVDSYGRYIGTLHLSELASNWDSRPRAWLYELLVSSSSKDHVWLDSCLGDLESLTRAIREAYHDDEEADMGILPGILSVSASQRCNGLLKHLTLHCWHIRALSALTALSYDEDRYGVVQTHVKQILSTLLGLSIAIEDFVKSNQFVGHGRTYAQLQGHQLLRPAWACLSDTVDTGIYRIVANLYEELARIELPPLYASRLQQYASFLK